MSKSSKLSIFNVKKDPNLSKNFLHWRISFVEHIFGYWHFLETSIFEPLYFQKWRPILTTFTQLKARLKNFLRGWLLVLGLKECLVECATLCVKSEVILAIIIAIGFKNSKHVMHFSFHWLFISYLVVILQWVKNQSKWFFDRIIWTFFHLHIFS